jgi:hypothetical protein
MNRYKARELLALPTDQLWALPEERHVLVFDDGELTTHTRATITSVYLWWGLIEFPETPMLKEFHIGDNVFSSKLVIRLINKVIWAIYDQYQTDPEQLAKLAFDTTNRFYNDFTVNLAPHVSTMSMFDTLDVMYHPDIQKANKEAEPFQKSIEEVCYPRLKEVLLSSPDLDHNPLALACRSGTAPVGQVLQCVGPRGFMTDINSDIFPEPIMTGYIEGINGLYESTIESRSGSKSLLYNKELLRSTEYFNRKTQLIAEYVQTLHPGDCGTTHCLDFPVLHSTLKSLNGKYHVVNGKLERLTGTETHLLNTTIQLRSILGCTHPDPAGICLTCYGELGLGIPRGTNLGQVSAVSMGDKITSSVLSTKHLDSTSRVEKYILPKLEAKFLTYGKEPEMLYLTKPYRNKSIRLVVARQEAPNLADVLMLNDLDNYPVSNASQLTMMQIIVDEGEEEQAQELLRVSLYNRRSSLSRELLGHIAKTRWTHDSRDNIVIDLTDFDKTQPILSLPFKHVNMHEVMKRIQSFLHSSSDSESKKLKVPTRDVSKNKVKYLKGYNKDNDPTSALVDFTTMLNEKLNINIAHCEVLLYAMMVRSIVQRDYRLPKPGVHGSFETYNNLMMNRSLSAAMAFEKQSSPLVSPSSFVYTERNDHPYDLIVMGGRTS